MRITQVMPRLSTPPRSYATPLHSTTQLCHASPLDETPLHLTKRARFTPIHLRKRLSTPPRSYATPLHSTTQLCHASPLDETCAFHTYPLEKTPLHSTMQLCHASPLDETRAFHTYPLDKTHPLHFTCTTFM